MKFNVHLYVAARCQLIDIEAETAFEAAQKAQAEFNPNDFFRSDDSTAGAVWDEAQELGALVDQVEPEDYGFAYTEYFALEGATAYMKAFTTK